MGLGFRVVRLLGLQSVSLWHSTLVESPNRVHGLENCVYA